MAGRRSARARSKAPSQLNGYRSQFERDVATDLCGRGVEFRYEDETLLYEIPCAYVPDFTLASGIIVETKGYLSPEDRRKLLELKRSHPARDIRLLFQRATNRLGRGPRSLTYAQWAQRHGFQWAEGLVPQSWIGDAA
jgi:hypothetical protein